MKTESKTTIVVQHCGVDFNWQDFTHHDADQLAAARKCVEAKENKVNFRIIRRTEEEIASPEPEPTTVQLIEDYSRMVTGVFFPKGTVLQRGDTGQYCPTGTPMGRPCVGCFDDIKDICREVTVTPKLDAAAMGAWVDECADNMDEMMAVMEPREVWDQAIAGIMGDVVVYDRAKVLELLVTHMEMSEEDAREYHDHNQESVPYWHFLDVPEL